MAQMDSAQRVSLTAPECASPLFPGCLQHKNFFIVWCRHFRGSQLDTYANSRTTLEARKGVGKSLDGFSMVLFLAEEAEVFMEKLLMLVPILQTRSSRISPRMILESSVVILFSINLLRSEFMWKFFRFKICKASFMSDYIFLRLPRYGTVIADNDRDIAGMGYDLFSPQGKSTCAALVFCSISSFGINYN
ncbi:hypothetical protein RHMOL_Rhmol01G0049700 [Rhododendron molle]|uniref:Uncharacterized protein n=1 Tax=Rhododendron molle TaxID=49168 RepID=A0ACC0PZN3_RHOML|nr:hypothetical protein RHMOL_Rhmol01G0049700 [Rhododendron molle]